MIYLPLQYQAIVRSIVSFANKTHLETYSKREYLFRHHIKIYRTTNGHHIGAFSQEILNVRVVK